LGAAVWTVVGFELLVVVESEGEGVSRLGKIGDRDWVCGWFCRGVLVLGFSSR
jgi:hypothetical protein